MSTKYFILSKSEDKSTQDDSENQIININKKHIYILPEVNLKYYFDNGLFEKGLIEWSKQFCDKNKLFLDIGAHTGTYTISLSNKVQWVFSFEPQTMTYYALCGSVALSNVRNATCLQFGLGSEEQVGEKTLKIVSNDGGGSSLHTEPGKNILSTEQIKIRTLDSFNLNNIGFIKMDVEENEIQVLKGAKATLIRSGYPKILFESNFENKELFGYIESMGYKVIKISGTGNMYLAEKK